MAGRMIKVISAHVTRDIEATYGIRGEAIRQFTFWKRQIPKREEPKYEHDESNFWTQQHCFFLFFMLLGNGFDTMPQCVRFSLHVSGGLFLLYQFIFSLLFTLPILYTEMFLGTYSGLTNSQMYRMMPISFGICVLKVFVDIMYAAMSSPGIAIALMAAVQHLLISHVDCPSIQDDPGRLCYDYKKKVIDGVNCTFQHMMLHCNRKVLLVVNTYHFWKDFRDIHDFRANWSLIIVTVVTWLFIVIIVNFKMKILELFLKILVILSIVMHLVLFILAISSEGAGNSLQNLVEFKIKTIRVDSFILSAFLMPIKANAIHGGGYMTYAASIKYKSKFGITTNTLLLLLANYALNIYFLMVFHAILGVVGHRTGIPYKEVFVPFVGMYCAVVSEFLRTMNCPHIFISIYHITNWMLESIKLTIIIRMHMNCMYDFFPKIVQFKAHSRIAWVGICSFIGMLNTMGICMKMVNDLMWMTNLYMMHGFELFIRSLLLFYGYGVSRLNDDIHFHTGKRPVKLWRIIWYLFPFTLLLMLIIMGIQQWNNESIETNFIANDMIYNEVINKSFFYICFGMSSTIFLGMFIISFLYVVLQMRASMRITLLTPLFYWGPPNKEARIARKAFTPRVAIRSQEPKKVRQRFREHSVRQQHERDIAERVKRGRLFLDKQFFSNLGVKQTEKDAIVRIKSKYSTYSYEEEQIKRKKKKTAVGDKM